MPVGSSLYHRPRDSHDSRVLGESTDPTGRVVEACNHITGFTATSPRFLSEGFEPARRLLNVLTDRYLFPFRERWFPVGGNQADPLTPPGLLMSITPVSPRPPDRGRYWDKCAEKRRVAARWK